MGGGRIFSYFIAMVFSLSVFVFSSMGYGQGLPDLPQPGTKVLLTPAFAPALIKGLTIHPEDPLQFDFIIDAGDAGLKGAAFRREVEKLVKYFLASLTVPEKDTWVNLSVYEKDRIIPQGFGQTQMGRDMLLQDYMLKQLTSSLISPEQALGREFWDKVYAKAVQEYGTTEIPIDAFHKIWILPDMAAVYEKDHSVFVVEKHLKVMLEEDYIALQKNSGGEPSGLDVPSKDPAGRLSSISAQIAREILIPAIEREVNEGKNFIELRQMYNSMILAKWYKENLRAGLLGQIYMDKNKISGVDVKDKGIAGKIYQQYVAALQKGVFNYIREENDLATGQMIPRKYFSGGIVGVVPKLDQRTGEEAMRAAAGRPGEKDFSTKVVLKGSGPERPRKAVTVDELIANYELSDGPHLLQAAVYEFAGVGDKDVYNSSIFQARVYPGDEKETTIIAGRVEDRTSELSRVMFFQQGPDGKWYPIKGAPVFENAQDPSVKKIGNTFVISMVKVEERGEKLSNGSPRLVYFSEFFQCETLIGLDPAKRLAQGPLLMKDIRLEVLQDGRILIMTRPQGGKYGPGKIGYFIVQDLKKFVELAEGGKEESLLAKMMEGGKVLEEMFADDQWGGANNIYLLENGNVGVLGHIARYNAEGNREYAPMTFEFDPDTGEFSSLKMIGRWEDLEKLLDQDIPIKVPDPKKPLDLARVWFGTNVIVDKGRFFLFGGVRDTRTVVAEIVDPFTSPATAFVALPESSGSPLGGINFNSELLHLRTQRSGQGISVSPGNLPVDLQHIDGFVPDIISITPVSVARSILLDIR